MAPQTARLSRTPRRAFTLVEIMIVVAIIGALAAIAIPNILRSRTSANESTAAGNFRSLASSLEMARVSNNAYPVNATWQATMFGPDCNPGTAPIPDFSPAAFCTTRTGGAAANTVQGCVYTYAGVADGTRYTLLAEPAAIGATGSRTFFADETGIVRHCLSPPAGTVANGPTWAELDKAPANPCT